MDELVIPAEGEGTFTIAVLGGGGVGKSSLILRLLRDEFNEEDVADPTLQDEYTGRVHLDDKSCTPPS